MRWNPRLPLQDCLRLTANQYVSSRYHYDSRKTPLRLSTIVTKWQKCAQSYSVAANSLVRETRAWVGLPCASVRAITIEREWSNIAMGLRYVWGENQDCSSIVSKKEKVSALYNFYRPVILWSVCWQCYKKQFLQMNHAKLRDDRMMDCWTVTTCMYGTAKMKGFNVLTYLWFKPYVVTI